MVLGLRPPFPASALQSLLPRALGLSPARGSRPRAAGAGPSGVQGSGPEMPPRACGSIGDLMSAASPSPQEDRHCAGPRWPLLGLGQVPASLRPPSLALCTLPSPEAARPGDIWWQRWPWLLQAVSCSVGFTGPSLGTRWGRSLLSWSLGWRMLGPRPPSGAGCLCSCPLSPGEPRWTASPSPRRQEGRSLLEAAPRPPLTSPSLLVRSRRYLGRSPGPGGELTGPHGSQGGAQSSGPGRLQERLHQAPGAAPASQPGLPSLPGL